MCEKMKLTGFDFLWPCDPQPRSRWFAMVEVNGAYKNGKYENKLVDKVEGNA